MSSLEGSSTSRVVGVLVSVCLVIVRLPSRLGNMLRAPRPRDCLFEDVADSRSAIIMFPLRQRTSVVKMLSIWQ